MICYIVDEDGGGLSPRNESLPLKPIPTQISAQVKVLADQEPQNPGRIAHLDGIGGGEDARMCYRFVTGAVFWPWRGCENVLPVWCGSGILAIQGVAVGRCDKT